MDPISIDDFRRLDLRIAQVLAAERVEGTDRLIKLTLDPGRGEPPRTVVAGIAQVYAAEELVGKQVALLSNLQPITMRGVRSEGMVLASGTDTDLALLVPERPRTPGDSIK